MASTRLTVTYNSKISASDVAELLEAAEGERVVAKLVKLLRGAASGLYPCSLTIEQSPTAASQTLVCDQSSAVATTDTLTVGGITCASVASAPDVTAGEWLLGASDATMATNIAAAINGHTTLSEIVSATADDDTVTITARTPGTLGNLVTLSEAGSGIALDGTALEGGDGGEAADETTYDFGV